jgi:hypothetical protein
MAKEESEFQKLLSEAPAAPSEDTVTAVGALSRTVDPARFVLTLANGRSETLEVAAVKSAKNIAGAIGQSLVQLELDAKRVPEHVRNSFLPLNFGNPFKPAGSDGWGFGGGEYGGGYGGGTRGTGFPDIASATGVDRLPAAAPFVATAPHHLSPAAFNALAQVHAFFLGTPTFYPGNNPSGYSTGSDPIIYHPIVLKPPTDHLY